MSQNLLGANAWPIIGLTRYYPATVGAAYSGDTLCVGTRTTAQTYQRLVVAPIYTGPGITLNTWSINVAAAAASAVYRIGLWTIYNQSNPFQWTAGTPYAKLFRDIGAAVGTFDISTTGNKALTDPVVLPPETWMLVGGVTQGATGANLTIGTNVSGIVSPYGLSASGLGINAAALVGLYQDSVSGPLGTFTPAGGANVGHGVAFARTA